jgi:glycosyltransferase involved in cell wall biosynthesis
LKILHLIPYFIRATKTGGPALQLAGLAESMQMLGQEVVIVTSTGNMNEDIDLVFTGDIYETSEHGLHTIYLRRKDHLLPPSYYYAPALGRWLKDNINRFDIVVIHGTWTYFSLIGARICQKANKPYLFFVHGSFDPWALKYRRIKKLPYWHFIEKFNFKRANGVIVLSQDEVEQVRAMGIEKPAFLARNGLLFPVQRVDDPGNLLACQWPALGNHPFVCFMSRLHPKKGLEVLLEAWSRVYPNYPEWRLVIAGPDEEGYLEILQSLIQKLGLDESVLFPGLVGGDVKAAFLQRASLFVLTSFSEGVPGAVTQAIAYGVPVLITPGCHLPEVADAQAGLVVEADVESVTSGLGRLLVDGNLRRQMGKNAERLARNEFDEMKVATGLVQFCQSLLN